jgi:DNA-binding PucR family transcriptional regulator
VYTVLPCEADPAPARDWLTEIARGLPEHVVIHAGIGGPAVPARLPDSRREADESLTLQASRPGRPAVAYDESWDEVLLHRLRMASSSGRRPADGPVADLIRHDTEHGTHFAATLRAWLRSQGDPAGAAELLAVHPNTVRNRIRRMGEHTRLGLDDPQMRLALAIALEIYVQDDQDH